MAEYGIGMFVGAFLTLMLMLACWQQADERALNRKIWSYGDQYFALEPMKLVKERP